MNKPTIPYPWRSAIVMCGAEANNLGLPNIVGEELGYILYLRLNCQITSKTQTIKVCKLFNKYVIPQQTGTDLIKLCNGTFARNKLSPEGDYRE